MNSVTTTPAGDILAYLGVGQVTPENAEKKSPTDDSISGDFSLALVAAMSQTGAVAQIGPCAPALPTPGDCADSEGPKARRLTALLANAEAQSSTPFATANFTENNITQSNITESNVTNGMDPAAILLSKPIPAVADVRSGKIALDSQWFVAPTLEPFVGTAFPSIAAQFDIDASQRHALSGGALTNDRNFGAIDTAIASNIASDRGLRRGQSMSSRNESLAPPDDSALSFGARTTRPFAEFSRVEVMDLIRPTAWKAENARQSMMASNNTATDLIGVEDLDTSLWKNISPRVGAWSPALRVGMKSEEPQGAYAERVSDLSNEAAPDRVDSESVPSTAKQTAESNQLLQRDPGSEARIMDLQGEPAGGQEIRANVAGLVTSGGGTEHPVEASGSVARLVIPDSAYADLRPGSHTIKVALEPETLGQAELTLRVIDDRVVGSLYVESTEAKRMVESSLDTLVARLHQEGLTLERLDVSLSGERGESPRRQELTSRRPGRNATLTLDEDAGTVESRSPATAAPNSRMNEIGPRRVNALA